MMPASQFDSWIAYSKEEPFGNPWENWLMATPALMFAQVHSKRGETPMLKDFFYESAEAKRERQQKEFIRFLETFEPQGEPNA